MSKRSIDLIWEDSGIFCSDVIYKCAKNCGCDKGGNGNDNYYGKLCCTLDGRREFLAHMKSCFRTIPNVNLGSCICESSKPCVLRLPFKCPFCIEDMQVENRIEESAKYLGDPTSLVQLCSVGIE